MVAAAAVQKPGVVAVRDAGKGGAWGSVHVTSAELKSHHHPPLHLPGAALPQACLCQA